MGKPSGRGFPPSKGGKGGKSGKGDNGAKGGKGGGGSKSGGGKNGFGGAVEAVEQGELKESQVQLGEASKDVILKLIARLMEARGDAVPSGQKRSKNKQRRRARAPSAEPGDEEEEEEEEAGLFSFADARAAGLVSDDDAGDAGEGGGGGGGGAGGGEEGGGAGAAGGRDEDSAGDDDLSEDSEAERERRKAAKEVAKAEERSKRRLMRQLLKDDRTEAKAAGVAAPESEEKWIPPQGNSVRLHFWAEDKRHEKPKGPITVPRGEADAVAELLKLGKAKLSLKGGSKKVMWAYVNGGLRGCDKHNKHPVPLTSTMELMHDDFIIFSVKSMPAPANAATNGARSAAQASPKAQAEAASPRSGGGPAASPSGGTSSDAQGCLDLVRAAYAKQRTTKLRPRTAEDVEKESRCLLAASQALEADPGHERMRRTRASLPAAEVREQFLEAVRSAQVVIVTGETGSGKTTQCPNFILEDYVARGCGGECTIFCAQPRRLAAIGVAERVSSERGESVGEAVGYAVRLDSRMSARTRLRFCTTGVLLKQLNEDPDLKCATHIVVDEAHERDLQIDFLLTLLRDLLPRRPDLKLVLMSATLEKGLLLDYFSHVGGLTRTVPAVHISGRTFPVTMRFIDDVKAVVKGRPGELEFRQGKGGGREETSEADKELQEWICRNMGAGYAQSGVARRPLVSPLVQERIDNDLVTELVAEILQGHLGPEGQRGDDRGAILIFLPGHAEIEQLLTKLRAHSGVGDRRTWLLPLHGQMATERQRLVFQAPPSPSQRKVVLATNIAETSITVEDVTHVIDCGHVKETRYDPRSRMAILATCFTSRAAAQQRAGRAGRVRPGVCWRLYSRQTFEQLPEHTLCEMRRTALEELVLQLRLLGLGERPGEFLQRAPQPPSADSVSAAIRTLVQIGALGPHSEGLPLTPLGFHLAHMPMDVRTAKMLLYGALMRCLGPMLTIAACLSEKSPFVRTFGREEDVKKERDDAFGFTLSDHLAIVMAFQGWQEAREKSREAETEYCSIYGLARSKLQGIANLRHRYRRHLVDVGFVPDTKDSTDRAWDPDANSADPAILRCVLCAGLYPNVAQIQRRSGGKGSGTVSFLVSAGDHDVCYVHPGSLNAGRLQLMQANHGWLLYHTKMKTSRVFLHDSTLIGSIPLLLFGGGQLQVAKDRRHIVLDGTLRFDGVAEETAVLLKLLRREVDRLLLMKIADPSADVSRTAEPLLKAVAELLHCEGARSIGVRS